LNALWDIILGWLALSGLLGFALMGFDKHQAREASRRIPERIFFALAFIGGTFGILLGTVAFHHKTQKGLFIGIILVSAALWLGGLSELARLIGLTSG